MQKYHKHHGHDSGVAFGGTLATYLGWIKAVKKYGVLIEFLEREKGLFYVS